MIKISCIFIKIVSPIIFPMFNTNKLMFNIKNANLRTFQQKDTLFIFFLQNKYFFRE